MQLQGSADDIAAGDRTSAGTGRTHGTQSQSLCFLSILRRRTGAGAEINTLTVGSTSQTDPGPTLRLVIRDFETNRPASPRD